MTAFDLRFHPKTKQAERIVGEILPGVMELFIDKNADYDIEGIDIAATLGVRGQWADMFRKIAKLKQEMWDQDGSGLAFELAEEVIKDLIGHCLLSLLFLEDEAEKKHQAKLAAEKKEYSRTDGFVPIGRVLEGIQTVASQEHAKVWGQPEGAQQVVPQECPICSKEKGQLQEEVPRCSRCGASAVFHDCSGETCL